MEKRLSKVSRGFLSKKLLKSFFFARKDTGYTEPKALNDGIANNSAHCLSEPKHRISIYISVLVSGALLIGTIPPVHTSCMVNRLTYKNPKLLTSTRKQCTY